MILSIISKNDEIVMLEGDGNYTKIHFSCGRAYTSSRFFMMLVVVEFLEKNYNLDVQALPKRRVLSKDCKVVVFPYFIL
jgi:hypothetical protein